MRTVYFIFLLVIASACIKERHAESPEFQKLPVRTQNQVVDYIHKLQSITFDDLGFTERWRPQYHLTPAFGDMGKPVSLLQHKNVWHLFYQHSSPALHLKNGWGHAITKDLVHWKLLPIAIIPDSLCEITDGAIVNDATNSSGLFGEKGGLVALFTQSNKETTHNSLAYSKDGLYWHRLAHPIDLGDFQHIMKVFWHEKSHQWVLIGKQKKAYKTYHSSDLKIWTKTFEFLSDTSSAYLDFYELAVDGNEQGEKWVLDQVDMGSLIGEFDGTHFYPEAQIMANSSPLCPNEYRITSSSPGKNRTNVSMSVLINQGSLEAQTVPWRGVATLPQEISLVQDSLAGFKVMRRPIHTISELYREKNSTSEFTADESPRDLKNDLIIGNLLTLNLEIHPKENAVFTLDVLKGDKEKTQIGYDQTKEVVFLNIRTSAVGSQSSQNKRFEAPLKTINGILKLRIFVDVSLVEVFGNDGVVHLKATTFPSPLSQQLVVSSQHANTRVLQIEAFQMYSFWKEEFYKIQRTIASQPQVIVQEQASCILEAGVFPYYLNPDSIGWTIAHPELAELRFNESKNRVTIKGLIPGNTNLIIDSYKGIPDTVLLTVTPRNLAPKK